MALFDRLAGYDPGFAPLTSTPKIGIHGFCSALAELARGAVTRADIITAFGIQPSEEAELDAVINKGGSLTADRKVDFAMAVQDWLMLAEGRYAYTTSASFSARLNGFS